MICTPKRDPRCYKKPQGHPDMSPRPAQSWFKPPMPKWSSLIKGIKHTNGLGPLHHLHGSHEHINAVLPKTGPCHPCWQAHHAPLPCQGGGSLAPRDGHHACSLAMVTHYTPHHLYFPYEICTSLGQPWHAHESLERMAMMAWACSNTLIGSTRAWRLEEQGHLVRLGAHDHSMLTSMTHPPNRGAPRGLGEGAARANDTKGTSCDA